MPFNWKTLSRYLTFTVIFFWGLAVTLVNVSYQQFEPWPVGDWVIVLGAGVCGVIVLRKVALTISASGRTL